MFKNKEVSLGEDRGHCGYTLEPPCRGSSNEYPQSMFWSKNKKK